MRIDCFSKSMIDRKRVNVKGMKPTVLRKKQNITGTPEKQDVVERDVICTNQRPEIIRDLDDVDSFWETFHGEGKLMIINCVRVTSNFPILLRNIRIACYIMACRHQALRCCIQNKLRLQNTKAKSRKSIWVEMRNIKVDCTSHRSRYLSMCNANSRKNGNSETKIRGDTIKENYSSDDEWLGCVHAQQSKKFDSCNGPLWRIRVFKSKYLITCSERNGDEHEQQYKTYLVGSFHHAIIDGISRQQFWNELLLITSSVSYDFFFSCFVAKQKKQKRFEDIEESVSCNIHSIFDEFDNLLEPRYDENKKDCSNNSNNDEWNDNLCIDIGINCRGSNSNGVTDVGNNSNVNSYIKSSSNEKYNNLVDENHKNSNHKNDNNRNAEVSQINCDKLGSLSMNFHNSTIVTSTTKLPPSIMHYDKSNFIVRLIQFLSPFSNFISSFVSVYRRVAAPYLNPFSNYFPSEAYSDRSSTPLTSILPIRIDPWRIKRLLEICRRYKMTLNGVITAVAAVAMRNMVVDRKAVYDRLALDEGFLRVSRSCNMVNGVFINNNGTTTLKSKKKTGKKNVAVKSVLIKIRKIVKYIRGRKLFPNTDKNSNRLFSYTPMYFYSMQAISSRRWLAYLCNRRNKNIDFNYSGDKDEFFNLLQNLLSRSNRIVFNEVNKLDAGIDIHGIEANHLYNLDNCINTFFTENNMDGTVKLKDSVNEAPYFLNRNCWDTLDKTVKRGRRGIEREHDDDQNTNLSDRMQVKSKRHNFEIDTKNFPRRNLGLLSHSSFWDLCLNIVKNVAELFNKQQEIINGVDVKRLTKLCKSKEHFVNEGNNAIPTFCIEYSPVFNNFPITKKVLYHKRVFLTSECKLSVFPQISLSMPIDYSQHPNCFCTSFSTISNYPVNTAVAKSPEYCKLCRNTIDKSCGEDIPTNSLEEYFGSYAILMPLGITVKPNSNQVKAFLKLAKSLSNRVQMIVNKRTPTKATFFWKIITKFVACAAGNSCILRRIGLADPRINSFLVSNGGRWDTAFLEDTIHAINSYIYENSPHKIEEVDMTLDQRKGCFLIGNRAAVFPTMSDNGDENMEKFTENEEVGKVVSFRRSVVSSHNTATYNNSCRRHKEIDADNAQNKFNYQSFFRKRRETLQISVDESWSCVSQHNYGMNLFAHNVVTLGEKVCWSLQYHTNLTSKSLANEYAKRIISMIDTLCSSAAIANL